MATFDKTSDGDTQLTFKMQFATKEECDKTRGFTVEKNKENFDKPEAMLSEIRNLR